MSNWERAATVALGIFIAAEVAIIAAIVGWSVYVFR